MTFYIENYQNLIIKILLSLFFEKGNRDESHFLYIISTLIKHVLSAFRNRMYWWACNFS